MQNGQSTGTLRIAMRIDKRSLYQYNCPISVK